MKLLYGTANPAKLKHMREMLEGLELEIIGLNEVDIQIDSIDESGNNPLENAKIKALAYYNATKMRYA
jgi:XTP/dITP diphosphohydrolase